MFHRVLVATGGSPWSNKAVEYAIGLAKDYGVELVILHVVADTPPYFIAEAGTSLDSIMEGSEETGRRILAEAARWAEEAGVSYETELAWGRVAEVICRVASERQCDLIVVGSRGLTGFKRLMLGSISNAVAAKAPCPVLVVKWYEK
ncbi:MAG: universal stress protein [Candidatus Tectimicrobiota bacterium]|nr:MAG: universal stress protein [Candidatus Tectomicrobia bacterium]